MEFTKIEDIISEPVDRVAEPPPTITPKRPPETPGKEPERTPGGEVVEVEQLEEETVSMPLDPEETADLIIEVFDGLQTFIYPKLYEASQFTKAEKAQLREVLNKLKDRDTSAKYSEDRDEPLKVEFSKAERKLLNKWDEAEIYGKEIVPLDEKDKSLLRKPLVKLLASLNVEMSPGAAVFYAVVFITVVRLLPVMGALKNKGK